MALTVLEALVLAVVQGITEWLPISSSGHLALAQRLLGVDVPVAYDLWLHVGTLLAVVVHYRHRLGDLVRACLQGVAATRQGGWRQAWLGHRERRLAVAVVVGTVPIVIAGVAFEALVHSTFNSLPWVGWTFLANAALLAAAGIRRPSHGEDQAVAIAARTPEAGPVSTEGVQVRDGLLAGAVQVLALAPAISRSGAAIAGGMWAGLDRRSAADLSFLLSIPALTGALVFQAPELARMGEVGWPAIVLGLVGTFVVGYASISALLAWVRRHSLAPFAAYSAVLGAVVLLWLVSA